jgi:hypothetical protein
MKEEPAGDVPLPADYTRLKNGNAEWKMCDFLAALRWNNMLFKRAVACVLITAAPLCFAAAAESKWNF